MTRTFRCAEASRTVVAALLCALCAARCGDSPNPPRPATAAPSVPMAPRDPRPFTPWHAVGTPLPFPVSEWFWQDLFAAAPAPEPIGRDDAAAAEIAAAFARIAGADVLRSEAEVPPLIALARRDLGALLAGLDDPRRDVRFAVARVMVRLMSASDDPAVCPFPQRLGEAAARHLRDPADEVALLHLETISAGKWPWMQPVLLKTFGKVDNHRLTVLRVRAAAKLAEQGCLGGVPLLIKVLKENTSIQEDLAREWEASFQTAWWKEEAIAGIRAVAGHDFGHSPDASDAEQVAVIRRIEQWWRENRIERLAAAPPPSDPELIARIRLLILSFGTFQLRNVDNAAFLLEGIGPGVAPFLFTALAGSSYRIRAHVLTVLARLADDVAEDERARWIERIVPSLTDPDEAVRVKALEAIGATAIPAALPHLEAALRLENPALCETALREVARQEPRMARAVLTRFQTKLPPGHLLATPLAAARLRAGDLEPLPDFLQRLTVGEPRSARYLSWIIEVDALADAKDPAERARALQNIEAAIRARADR